MDSVPSRFSALQRVPFKGDVCARCFGSLPMSTGQSEGRRSNVPKFLLEFAARERIAETAACDRCGRIFHGHCVNFNVERCLCGVLGGARCGICGGEFGLVESFGGRPVHFICAFFSRRFHILSFDSLHLVPLDSPTLETEERECQLCSGVIGSGDGAFSCGCGYASHLSCALFLASHFDLAGEDERLELDFSGLPLPFLGKLKEIPGQLIVDPLLTSGVWLLTKGQLEDFGRFLVMRGGRSASTRFEFELLCPAHTGDVGSCFCLQRVKDATQAQCELCGNWLHAQCIAPYELPRGTLDSADLARTLPDFADKPESALFTTDLPLPRRRAAKLIELGDVCFGCPSCQLSLLFALSKVGINPFTPPAAPAMMLFLARRFENMRRDPADLGGAWLRQDCLVLNAAATEFIAAQEEKKESLETFERDLLQFLAKTGFSVGSSSERIIKGSEELPCTLRNITCLTSAAGVSDPSASTLGGPSAVRSALAGFEERARCLRSESAENNRTRAYSKFFGKLLDFLNKNRPAAVTSLERKLRKLPHPEIRIGLARLINGAFLSPLAALYRELNGLLPPAFEAEPSQLTDDSLEGLTLDLFRRKRATPAVVATLARHNNSFFAANFAAVAVKPKEFFEELSPFPEDSIALEKLKELLSALFVAEEHIPAGEKFIREIFSRRNSMRQARLDAIKSQTSQNEGVAPQPPRTDSLEASQGTESIEKVLTLAAERLELTPEAAAECSELAAEARRLGLSVRAVEERTDCFEFARELNSLSLNVYSLDCEDDFSPEQWLKGIDAAEPSALQKLALRPRLPYLFPAVSSAESRLRRRFAESQLSSALPLLTFASRAEDYAVDFNPMDPPLPPPAVAVDASGLTRLATEASALTIALKEADGRPPGCDTCGPRLVARLDAALRLGATFVVDCPVVASRLRAMRSLKFNAALLERVRVFHAGLDAILSGTKPPETVMTFREVFALVARRSKHKLSAGVERLLFETSRAFAGLCGPLDEFSRTDLLRSVPESALRDVAAELARHPRTFAAQLDMLVRRRQRHEKLCDETAEIITKLCELDLEALVGKSVVAAEARAKLDDSSVECPRIESLRLALRALERLADERPIHPREIPSLLAPLNSTSALVISVAEQLRRADLLDTALAALKSPGGEEFDQKLAKASALAKEGGRLLSGGRLGMVEAELRGMAEVVAGKMGPLLEGRFADVVFPHSVTEKLRYTLAALEAVNACVATGQRRLSKLEVFLLVRELGALRAPQLSMHVSILAAEVAEVRRDFDTQSKKLDLALLRFKDPRDLKNPEATNSSDCSFSEEFRFYEDKDNGPCVTARERMFFLMKVAMLDLSTCLSHPSPDISRVRHLGEILGRRSLSRADRLSLLPRQTLAAFSAILVSKHPSVRPWLEKASSPFFTNSVEPLLPQSFSEIASIVSKLVEEFIEFSRISVADEQRQIVEYCLESLAQPREDWSSPLELFKTELFPQAEIERLSKLIASLFEPESDSLPPGLKEISTLLRNDPPRYRAVISQYVRNLNENAQARTEIAKHGFDPKKFVGLALQLAERDSITFSQTFEIQATFDPPSKRPKTSTIAKNIGPSRLPFQLNLIESSPLSIYTASVPRKLPSIPSDGIKISGQPLDSLPVWVKEQLESDQLLVGWLEPSKVRELKVRDHFPPSKKQIHSLDFGILAALKDCGTDVISKLELVAFKEPDIKVEDFFAIMIPDCPKIDNAPESNQ